MDSIEEFCVKTEIIRGVASILKKGLLIEFRTKRVAKEIYPGNRTVWLPEVYSNL